MKLKIEYAGSYELQVMKKGDWVDLKATSTVTARKWEHKLIPLGIAMSLPKGYSAIIVPRSSTFRKHKFIIPNSMGVIDNSYRGDMDIWQCPAHFMEDSTVMKDSRICQFRVELNQFATTWQKLKWMFTSGIRFVRVDHLREGNRGGFGSTGQF